MSRRNAARDLCKSMCAYLKLHSCTRVFMTDVNVDDWRRELDINIISKFCVSSEEQYQFVMLTYPSAGWVKLSMKSLMNPESFLWKSAASLLSLSMRLIESVV